MLKRLVIVGFITALGVGGAATPSFADTGASVDVCDSAVPNCSIFVVQTQLSGPVFTVTGDCVFPGLIPTVNDSCVYAEVDYPVAP